MNRELHLLNTDETANRGGIEKAIRKLKCPAVNSKLPYGQEGRKKPGQGLNHCMMNQSSGDE